MKRPQDNEPCNNCQHWVNNDCELGRYNSSSLVIFGFCGTHKLKTMKKSYYEVRLYDKDCKVPSDVTLYEDLQQAKQRAEESSKDNYRVEIHQAFCTEDVEGAIDWQNTILIESYTK